MKARYGYRDGADDFFIVIDTDQCIDCLGHACMPACPAGILEIIVDDYDDEIAAVVEGHRKRIKYSCAACKPVPDRPPLPCVTACTSGAITHSW